LHRGLDQPVLIDPAQALELRGPNDGPQVVAGPGLVDHLDLGAGQRRLDQRLHLGEVGH
jgi:hypothetical protein